MLGWRPDDSIAFRYRVFTAYDNTGAKVYHPGQASPPPNMNGTPGGVDTFAVNWSELNDDLDGDG